MSKYAQLPRGTLELLTHRAQRGMFSKEYVDWAGNALADGFDSHSLEILAGLSNDIVSQNEAPDYFLKAVKELALPIPDCELALGNREQTMKVYRQLGLSLPGEWVMVGQHLDELAEQIKESVLDPVVGLERIYRDVIDNYRFGWGGARSDDKDWNGEGIWAWDELWDYIQYDNYGDRYKELGAEQINQEIKTFAAQWLKDKTATFTPDLSLREEIPESERRKSTPISQIVPKPTPSIQSHDFPETHVPVAAALVPERAELVSRKLNTVHGPKPRKQASFESQMIRLLVIWVLSPLLIAGVIKFRDLPMGVLIVALVLGLSTIGVLADRVAKALGTEKKK